MRAFYRNRLPRTYPLFLALTAFGFVVQWVTSGVIPLGLSDVPSQVFAVQFNHHYPLNGVFWTLGVEIQFYLAAPLLVMVFIGEDPDQVLRIGALFAAALVFSVGAPIWAGWEWDGRNLLSNLPLFLTGMAACWWVIRCPVPDGWAVPLLGAVVGVLAVSNSIYHLAPGAYWRGGGMVSTCAAVALLIGAHNAMTRRGVSGARLTGPLGFLGVLSYGLYAWHPFVMEYWPRTVDHLWLFVVASLVAAWLTYRLVERPAQRFRARADGWL